ncbi:m-phase inducer phosphatase [Coemansia spiralis]|uniref:M-phase inducer phosphatase n=1 Tax=Coemansia spiralis TaxID=417178 RepID=A0A9W8G7Y5_9FUNG|nr:m-phase inducer phosphatase [Coemansia spiralis]
MNTLASDRLSSSSHMGSRVMSNPFGSPLPQSRHRSGSMTAPSTGATAVATPGTRMAFGQASAPPKLVVSGSPVGSLVVDLNSNLHLESSTGRPPAFEPFRSPSPECQATPLLLRSRKRQLDEQSPALAFNSPTTLWARNRTRARPSMLAGTPRQQTLSLFRRESLNTDDYLLVDSSFDDDGSLTSLPKMRGSALSKTILEDHQPQQQQQQQLHQADCTPLRGKAGSIKRVRSQAAPSFQPIREEEDCARLMPAAATCPATPTSTARTAEFMFSPSFSPSTRSQPECHLLPCSAAPTDPIMRIEAQTASELFAGQFDDLYDEKIVVDCRFPYEYEGGHIAGAVNAPTPEALEKLLLDRPRSDRRVVVVLHCEYSIQRAPSMASHLRRRDREVNMHRYPYLHYPEIYVLKGGYRHFFGTHRLQCEPQSYVEMNDQAHAVDCRQRMLQFNRQFKRTKSMNDAALCRGAPGRSRTVGSGALFVAQSPTMQGGRTASLLSSSSLPARPRRLGRTQSARPGINLIDFAQR